MIMVSFSIIATVVVLNFHHKPPLSTVMPKWAYRFFVKTLPQWLAIGSHPNLPHSISASERLVNAAKENDLVISNYVMPLRDLRRFCYGESDFDKLESLIWQFLRSSIAYPSLNMARNLAHSKQFEKLL